MNRLVRIALTFLASATVLVFIVRQRALKLQTDIDAGISQQAIADETQMITLGTVFAGLLIVAGIALIGISFARRKKSPPRP